MNLDPRPTGQQETSLLMSMKMVLVVGGTAFLLIFGGFFVYFNVGNTEDAKAASAILSAGNGNWDQAATWDKGVIPTAGDNVKIAGGHTVTIPGSTAASTNDLEITGKLIANNDLTVSGDLRIKNDGILDAPNNKDLSVAGGFDNDGTFNERNSVAVFNGSNAQTIEGNNSITFNKFTVNNTSSTGITLAAPVNVDNTLTLTDGLLYTDATNKITMAVGAVTSGGSSSSYIAGPISANSEGTNDIVFGTGKNGKYKEVTLSPSSSSATEFTVDFFNSAYSNTSSLAAGLNNVSTVEYFQIDRVSGTANATVMLTWETDIGVDDLTSVVVAFWDGTEWTDQGQSASSGNSASGSVTSNAVTSFGPFVVASTDGNNALPIKLLSFDAKVNLTNVELKWGTAVEINNDYFTIFRSTDGESYEELTEIAGAGNSNYELEYSVIDDNPIKGIAYYKLKQTDFDGKYEEFPPISVNFISGKGSIKIYPNPVTEGSPVNVSYVNNNFSGENVDIEIYDISGKLVFSESFEKNNTDFQTTLNISNDLTQGNYIITITTEYDNHSQQLVVK